MLVTEQAELDAVRDAVAKLFAPYADPKAPSAVPRAWRDLLSFGVGGDPREDGLGATELAVIAREMGAVVAVAPVVAGAALTGLRTTALRDAAGAVVEAGRIPAVVSGRQHVRAVADRDGWVLDGVAAGVVGCAVAADLIVSAVTDVGAAVIAIVPLETAGISLSRQSTNDLRLEVSRVRLDHVVIGADRASPVDADEADLHELWATVVVSAEATGAAHRLAGLAVEYACQREQFDRPIGSFQAVQHLLAETHVLNESMWSVVRSAAEALDNPAIAVAECRVAVSVAKAYVSSSAREVAHLAMQVFGGIAFTTEHEAHHYLRRILDDAQAFGDAAHHEALLGAHLVSTSREARG